MYERLDKMEEKGDTTRKTERISTRPARDGNFAPTVEGCAGRWSTTTIFKICQSFRDDGSWFVGAICSDGRKFANGEGEMQFRAGGAGM